MTRSPLTLEDLFGDTWQTFELDDPVKMPDSSPIHPGGVVKRWMEAQVCAICDRDVVLPTVHLTYHIVQEGAWG